jgi:hypothetical protein
MGPAPGHVLVLVLFLLQQTGVSVAHSCPVDHHAKVRADQASSEHA